MMCEWRYTYLLLIKDPELKTLADERATRLHVLEEVTLAEYGTKVNSKGFSETSLREFCWSLQAELIQKNVSQMDQQW